jgi:hypothetical protein
MGLRWQLQPRERFLYVAVGGPFDLPDAQGCIGEVFAMCSARQCAKVFVDARGVEGPIAVGERYEFAAFLAGAHGAHLEEGHGAVRLVFLVHESVIDPGRIGEMVARNRGADVRAFSDSSKAATWLGIEQHAIP